MSDTFQLRHMMIRVLDLDKSISFYTEVLGMEVLRQNDNEGGRYTNTFLGYGPEDTNTVLELTFNWDQKDPYDLGTGFGHLALGVRDIYGVCAMLEKAGAKITRPPGPVKFGTRHIAFIEDPDGYKIELIDLDT